MGSLPFTELEKRENSSDCRTKRRRHEEITETVASLNDSLIKQHNSTGTTAPNASSGNNEAASRDNDTLLTPQVLSAGDNPPSVIRNEDTVDSLVAQELNRLSLKDRKEVLYDLHGLSEGVCEEERSSETIRSKLQEFDERLNRLIHSSSKVSCSAYDLAQKIDPRYVLNGRFRMAFLRADKFNAEKAVRRFIGHFELKQRLFGVELLARDITQDDLDPDTLKLLYCGWFQDLPIRDNSGRIVTCVFNKLRDPSISLTCKMKRLFYCCMANSVDDPESQVRGRVVVAWLTGSSADRTIIWHMAKALSVIPMRFTAFHACFAPQTSFVFAPIIALGQIAAETFYRLRARIHTGSVTELKYALQTFGIPVEALPVHENGDISIDRHRTKWAKRRQRERMQHFQPSGNSVQIAAPKQHDVLLGREASSTMHLGNMSLRSLVEEYRERYEQASKTQKSQIAREIVAIVHGRRGRFLKHDETNSYWTEIDDQAARQKVASSFRFLRKDNQVPK